MYDNDRKYDDVWWLKMSEDKPEGQWPSSEVYITPCGKNHIQSCAMQIVNTNQIFQTKFYPKKSAQIVTNLTQRLNKIEINGYFWGGKVWYSLVLFVGLEFWVVLRQYVVISCLLSRVCQTKYWQFEGCPSIKYWKPIHCHWDALA